MAAPLITDESLTVPAVMTRLATMFLLTCSGIERENVKGYTEREREGV